jgi:membrane associated rhomboid family serine protease
MGKVYLYGFIGLPGILMAVGYILYSRYMDKQQKDNVNHDAHLWGALYGVAYTIVLKPAVLKMFWIMLTRAF